MCRIESANQYRMEAESMMPLTLTNPKEETMIRKVGRSFAMEQQLADLIFVTKEDVTIELLSTSRSLF